jgi:nucleotide-binding universal stress UspA family protein
MPDSPTPSSILIDLPLPDPEPAPDALIDLLSSLRVVLVGWYRVPEQTSPEQARDQLEDELQSTLDAIAEPFRAAGGEVDTRLVFTANELDTVSRISTEEQVDAVLVAGPLDTLSRILVPVRGRHNAARIAAFVADLVRNPDAEVTLFHVIEEEETEERVRADVLEPITELMIDRGIEADAILHEVVTSDAPADTIVERSADYDVLVLGETEPSLRDFFFGSVPENIARNAQIPVLVVRHEREDADAAARAAT